jgi:ribosome-associated toxin RatA of RatAB toxin-antitoxin module
MGRRILKGLAWVAAALIGVALLITATGYALPQSHVASSEARLSAPPDRVFDAITDVARYPEWRPDIQRADIITTTPLTWTEYDARGDGITFEVVDSRRAERHRVRIADPDLPFGGTWTYALYPDGAGTRLVITEHGEVYNPIFRFMSRFVFGHTASVDAFLAGLARRVG